jgi:hypothetical protein
MMPIDVKAASPAEHHAVAKGSRTHDDRCSPCIRELHHGARDDAITVNIEKRQVDITSPHEWIFAIFAGRTKVKGFAPRVNPCDD